MQKRKLQLSDPARVFGRGVSAVLVSLALQVGAPRAALAQSAEDVEVARACFLEAARVASEGRWKEARELYARSLQLKSAPITRYSLGVAEQETGHLADALASFRSFLSEPAAPGTERYVESARSAIVTLEARVGRLTLTLEPKKVDGLALAIDGQPVPPVPEKAFDVDPGAHEVVARAPGFRPASGRFTIAPGGAASVSLTLLSVGAAPTVREVADVKPAPTPIVVPVRPSAPGAPSSKLPFILMGTGGALLISGIAIGLVGVNEASAAPTRDGPAASGAQAKAVAGDMIGGAGIAAAGVGLIFLLTHGRTTQPTALALRPAITSAGAGLQMHF